MQTPKYKSLAEVKEAFDSGELKAATDHLLLDNDSVHPCCFCEPCDEFDGGPHYGAYHSDDGPSQVLKEALTLLGIAFENA